jgi:hypothetical protein
MVVNLGGGGFGRAEGGGVTGREREMLWREPKGERGKMDVDFQWRSVKWVAYGPESRRRQNGESGIERERERE